jgi:hypothetical protein
MKTTPALLVIAIAVPIAALNPVTRVVELLEGLSKKLTFEAKEEEDLYDKYVCWAQTVIQTKTATNEAAQTRIESLETYIADIEAGRVEFTSERADLEKQIAELNAGMEKAGDLRDQEHEDFEAAKEEMEIAIKALDEAIKVLSDAGKGKLLSVKFDLRRILTIGTNILSKNDQKYLEQELDADVPRINKKSPFKGKYVAKSKKILQILEDMQKTFEDNLDDAEDKEKKAKKSYDSLMESKGKELDTAKEALTDLSGEGGARGVAKDRPSRRWMISRPKLKLTKASSQTPKRLWMRKNQSSKSVRNFAWVKLLPFLRRLVCCGLMMLGTPSKSRWDSYSFRLEAGARSSMSGKRRDQMLLNWSAQLVNTPTTLSLRCWHWRS